MFGLSLSELLFLGVLALLVIGPKQLPELARTLGRFLNDLKRSTEGLTDDLKNQTRIDFDLTAPRRRRPTEEPPAEAAPVDPQPEGTAPIADSSDKPEKPT